MFIIVSYMIIFYRKKYIRTFYLFFPREEISMRNILLKKGLVIGFFVLFFGAVATSGISVNINGKINVNNNLGKYKNKDEFVNT